jgi:hypothetical protein
LPKYYFLGVLPKMWMRTCGQMQKTGLTSIATVSVSVDGVYTNSCILESLKAKE